ncbi:ANTAR domain-containing protein [Amycolatopsis sp. QT-25]|uniref:ANTAR domain-containing protein n=1 Tax=Amycolatopsis sp. QT-25 TaxID=3034022 RepID=UPI0023EC16F0|nr:ANTAR domain-containing protein [Amycolatopsis sp. QT-25]WET76454.1 ANTAR domain-containing protein [Amycolatopsis sp. QT-25]
MQEEPSNVLAERDQLKNAMATLPVIEQAKGMIRLLCGISSEEAFAALKTVSQHSNVKLRTVADVIVAAGSGTPHTMDSDTVGAVLAEIRKTVLGRAFAD